MKVAIEVNEYQRFLLYYKLKKLYKNLEGLNISILGISFKPDTDDLRESPAIDNIVLLLEAGTYVKAYDPICGDKIFDTIKNKLVDEKFDSF